MLLCLDFMQVELRWLLMHALLSKVQSARPSLPTKQMLTAMGLVQILLRTNQEQIQGQEKQ